MIILYLLPPEERQKPRRRAPHPCRLRLKDSSGLSVTTPLSLVSAGYASIAMGLLTGFRVTPFLLGVLTYQYRNISPTLDFSKVGLYVFLFTWIGLVLFVLLILGVVLAASQRVTKRWALMLHPWGLLLLYLDMFVWISLILWMHMQVVMHPELHHRMFDSVYHPLVYFIIMYVECVLFGVIYYVYATYFIAAELTVIENFF